MNITPTLSSNAAVVEWYTSVAASTRSSNWEYIPHSYVQMPTHALEDEEANLIKPIEICGKYTGDFVFDDEPCVLDTDYGPLDTQPYTLELNDILMMIVQNYESSYLKTRIVDQFDRLYLESRERVKFLSFAIHPYISTAPHRIKYLEEAVAYMAGHDGVEFWTGEQIYDWYAGETCL